MKYDNKFDFDQRCVQVYCIEDIRPLYDGPFLLMDVSVQMGTGTYCLEWHFPF